MKRTFTVDTKFYTFDQNNSGGYYFQNTKRGVAKNIVIEAVDARDAYSKLERITNGFTDYCECCGERWSYYVRDEDGTDEPMKYDTPIREYIEKEQNTGWDFNDNAAIHYYDGSVEWIGKIPEQED